MAKGPKNASPDDIMSASEMRPLLSLVRRDGEAAISCAVGLTAEKDAVILLSRQVSPRKLRAEAAKKARSVGLAIDERSLCFGRASLEGEATLLLTVNKQSPGAVLAAAVRKRVRGAGFTEVVFSVDESLDAEPREESRGDAVAAAAGAAPAQQAGPAATAGQLRASFERIVPLLRAAMAGSDGHRATLSGLANAFAAALRSDNLDAARSFLAEIAGTLKAARGAEPQGGSSRVNYAKLRLDWDTARKAAAQDLSKLEAAILEEFRSAPDLEDITVRVRKLDTILEYFGADLQDKLDEAMNAEEGKRLPIHSQARAIISRYRAYVEKDEFVTAMQSNRFVPVTLQTRLSDTLKALSAALA